jgi:iron complex transport system ATP-binding protein
MAPLLKKSGCVNPSPRIPALGGVAAVACDDEKTRKDRCVVNLSHVSLVIDDTSILDDVSWRVRASEQWAIVGPNGSGKTALLKITSGYLWPTTGTIAILGHPFGGIDLRELRKRIGWVSSALHELLPRRDSALDIALSGMYGSIGLWAKPPRQSVDRAQALLRFMKCDEVAAQRFGVLSQGEQQKILIARALMSNPQLLVLDEPCAGMDIPARESVLEILERLGRQQGLTLLFVTHHIEEIAPIFSHVLVLKAGSVIAKGRKDRVLTDRVLSEAFALPVGVIEKDGRYWHYVPSHAVPGAWPSIEKG